ncbi:MAG: T9SS type A sorting domain-containing protein, partial [Algicola sp.]|nr:T9SS type A sorting domain-containing protein [Algicola sp.]
ILECGDYVTGDTSDGGPEDVIVGGFTGNWYSFIGTGDDIAIFSTCNDADYDTFLSVYTDCGSIFLTSNDDATGCGLTSEVGFFAEAGVEYNIFVEGFFTDSVGNYGLTVSCDPAVTRQQLADNTFTPKDEITIDFTAYPVPFDNEVNIAYSFEFETNVTIELFDTKGLLVLSQTNDRYVAGSKDVATFDLSRSSSQMFYVKLTTSQGTVTKKIVSSGK